MEAVELVRKVFDAFSRRDLDTVLELIDPEAELHAVTGELAHGGRPYVGVEGMHEYFADVDRVWSQLRLSPSEFEAHGDLVLVTGRVWAYGSGRVVDSPAGWVWRVRDGRVTYLHVYQSDTDARAAAAAAVDQ